MARELTSKIKVNLDGELNALEEALRRADNRIDLFEERWGEVEKTINAVSKAALVAGTAIVGSLTYSVVKAAEFRDALGEVATLGVQNMGKLEDGVIDVAARIGGDLVTTTKAAYQALSAGVPEDNLLEFLDQAGRAAVAGVSDVFTSVDFLTSVVNAFGEQLEGAAQASDLAFTAIKAGKTTMDELAAATGRLAPLWATTELGAESMFAALATLTKGGIATAESVSGLRAMLSNVLKPTAEAQKLAEELGIDFSLTGLQALGFEGFLRQLTDATGGNAEQMSMFFGSIEALNTVLALTGPLSSELTAIMDQMADSAGATDAAFDAATEGNPAFVWRQLQAEMMGLVVVIGRSLLPLLQQTLDFVRPIIQGVREWVQDNPELAATLTILAGALGSALVVLGALGLAISPIVTGFLAFWGAITALVTVLPVLLASAALLAPFFIAAAIEIIDNWGAISAFFFETAEEWKLIFEDVVNWLRDLWDRAGQDTDNFGERVKNFIALAWADIFENTNSEWNTRIWPAIKTSLDRIVNEVSAALVAAVPRIAERGWNLLLLATEEAFKQLLAKVLGLVDVERAWQDFWDGMAEFWGPVVDGVVAGVQVLIGWLSTLKNWLVDVHGWLTDVAASVFSAVLPESVLIGAPTEREGTSAAATAERLGKSAALGESINQSSAANTFNFQMVAGAQEEPEDFARRTFKEIQRLQRAGQSGLAPEFF